MGLFNVVAAISLHAVLVSAKNEGTGMLIWMDRNKEPQPRLEYSLWDGNGFSTLHEMGDIANPWGKIRGDYSAVRDEAIVLGRVTNNASVTAQVQVYSKGRGGGGHDQWSDLLHSPLYDDTVGNFLQSSSEVKVMYESQSGNLLIVWNDVAKTTTRYAKWTGSRWRLGNIMIPVPSRKKTVLTLYASPMSNEMLLMVNTYKDGKVYATVWNGASWGAVVTSEYEHNPSFYRLDAHGAFESKSGRAMIVHRTASNSLAYRIWNGVSWSEEDGLVSPPVGIQQQETIRQVRLSADPSTNRLAVALSTYPNNTIWATVWDGHNTWESKAILEPNRPKEIFQAFAIAFEGTSKRALVTYAHETSGEGKYRTWSTSSGWSDEAIGPDLGVQPEKVICFGDKESNEIMLAASQHSGDGIFSKWSGGAEGWGEIHRMTNNDTDQGTRKNPIPLFMWMQLVATKAPTALPLTPSPKPVPASLSHEEALVTPKLSVTMGHRCESNSECQSKTCRNGVCMATSACYPLRHKFGQPFFEHKINIVFVASGFDTATSQEWHANVNHAYKSIEKYKMFSNEIEQLNMFRVDPEKLDSSFCSLDCVGIPRLLCCDQHRARNLAQRCFPVGSNLQTVVIHNDERYGGGGYVQDNIATATTHPMASVVAAHELGHSLFDLTDEYSYGSGSDKDPNCDSTSNCDKWSDLIGNTPDGYDPVRCLPGCRNRNYYVGTNSLMHNLNSPMGAVNERFTCCTYCALTKSFPSYCEVFDPSPNYLLNYCKNNDYQRYGSASYDREPLIAISDGSVKDSTTKYVQVSHPVVASIASKKKRSDAIAYKAKLLEVEEGMFLRSRVEGDFSSLRMAVKHGCESLFKVLVFYRTGKDTLFYCRNTTIEVPISLDAADDNGPIAVSEIAGSLDIVLDTQERKVKKVKVKAVDL